MMLVLLLLLPWTGLDGWHVAGMESGLAAVVLVGAWDDISPRSVRLRLAVQGMAITLLAASLLAAGHHAMGWLLLAVPCGMWSVNLHNFMDGIDGLLAGHCLVAASALAALALVAGLPATALLAGVFAASCAGFLCLNWAPARIFMGDAGSGGCGWLIFALGLDVVLARPDLCWAVAALSSSFVADASLTLAHRIRRRRRWSQPHREHLYQWQVRSGRSHAGVSLAYLAWDAAVAAWVLLQVGHGGFPPAACVAVYALATALWLRYKSRCRRQRRERRGL